MKGKGSVWVIVLGLAFLLCPSAGQAADFQWPKMLTIATPAMGSNSYNIDLAWASKLEEGTGMKVRLLPEESTSAKWANVKSGRFDMIQDTMGYIAGWMMEGKEGFQTQQGGPFSVIAWKFAMSGSSRTANSIVCNPSSYVSPGIPKRNGVLTLRPTSCANCTAFSICRSVVPFLIMSRFFCTPLSAPKSTAQHPASRKALSRGRSTWLTHADANQTRGSFLCFSSPAIRIARSFTGKKKIVKYMGHYHGWGDQLMTDLEVPGSGRFISHGIPSEILDLTVLVAPNDLEGLEQAFRQHTSGAVR